MYRFDENRKLKERVTIVVAIIISLLFISFIWVNREELAKDMPDYVAPGVYKVKLDGHEYYKSDNALTHSESCPCKKVE